MSKSPSPVLPDSKRWGLPLIVFAVALFLRLLGLGWGLPNAHHQESYHPDEPLIWYASQQIEPAKMDFTPGFYNYGTLYLTTLKIASDVVAGYTGGPDPKKPDEAWNFLARAHFAGRLISAFAGAGTALMVFLILRRFSTDLGAMFGGLLVAFAPAHVVHSRFQTVDILAAFLISVSAFYALKLIPKEGVEEKRSDMRIAVLSGLFAGLSAGTKYTGILCLLTLFVAIYAVKRPTNAKLALVGLGTALLAFLITTPGFLLENAAFMQGFLYETKHVKEGHGLVFEGTSSGFIYHFTNLLIGVGTILALMGLAGLFGGAFRKHWWAIALAAFFVPYYLLIGGAEVKFIRYTFPLFIALGVGFGWLVGKAREKEGKWHLLVGLGILGLGGLFGGGLQSSMRFTAWMGTADPREQAGAYLAEQKGTVGLVSDPWFYTAAVHPQLGRRLYMSRDGQIKMTGYGVGMDQALLTYTDPSIARYVPLGPDGQRDLSQKLDWDDRLLIETKPDFVVYSSFESEGLERIKELSNPSPVGKVTSDRAFAFLDQLAKDYDQVKIYGVGQTLVHDLMYVQPSVVIWKRKTGH